MNKLKALICGLMLVCVGFAFVGCGDNEKDFDAEKVVFSQNQFTYDGNAHIFDITYDGVNISALYSLDNEIFTDKDQLAIIDAGEYKVYFKITAEGYGEYVGDHTITIAKADFYPTKLYFTRTQFVYDGTNKSFNVTYEDVDDLTVKYSLDEGDTKTYVNKSELNLSAIGTHTVYYSVSAPNYNTYYGQKDVTIGKQVFSEANFNIGATSFTYNGETQVFDITYSDVPDITVKYSLDKGDTKNYVTKEELVLVDAGTYTVYYSVETENYAPYYGYATVTIENGEFVASNVRVGERTFAWDGTGQVFNVYYDGVSGVTVKYSRDEGENKTWVTKADFPALAPSETAYTVYYQISAAGYNAYESSTDVTINKGNMSKNDLTITNQTVTYNGQAQMFTMQYTKNISGVSADDFEYWYCLKQEESNYTESDWVQDPTQLGLKDCKISKSQVVGYDVYVYVHDTKGRFNDYGEKTTGSVAPSHFYKRTFTINKATLYSNLVQITDNENVIYDGTNTQFPTITYTGAGGNSVSITYNTDGGTVYKPKTLLKTFTVGQQYTLYYCIDGDNFDGEIKGSVNYKINERPVSVKFNDGYQFVGSVVTPKVGYVVTSAINIVGNSEMGYKVVNSTGELVGVSEVAAGTYQITANAMYGHAITSENGNYYILDPTATAATVSAAMSNIVAKTYNNAALGTKTEYTLSGLNALLGTNAITDFYIEVAAARNGVTQTLYIDGEEYKNDSTVKYSIGNANYIVDKAFIVEDGKMKVSAILLGLLTNSATMGVTVSADSDGLVVTQKPASVGISIPQYEVIVKNGTTMLLFKSAEFGADDICFAKKVCKNARGEVIEVSYGASAIDVVGSDYCVALYPIGWIDNVDISDATIPTKTIEFTVYVVGKGSFTVELEIEIQ